MARGKRNTGRRPAQPTQRHTAHNDPAIIAAQKEAERRERILADTRRTAAKWRPKIPEVRKCNFENFKNHFHGLDEKSYAIDVLMRGTTLDGQIRREQAYRRKEELARIRQSYMLAYGGLKEQSRTYGPHTRDSEERVRREKKAEIQQATDTEIHRIRIQSQPILGHLTSLLNDTEQRSTPRTFLRPFKSLVYFQPKMKEILASLEEKWADVEDLDDSSSEKLDDSTPEEAEFVEAVDEKDTSDEQSKDGDKDDDDDAASIVSVDSNAEDLDGIMDSVEALRDMRCYVKFIDEEIMPQYNQYNGTSAERVKFDDLWSLFRVGDLICMPAAGETAGRYHEVWRIYRIELPTPEAGYPSSGWEFFMDELQQNNKKETFNIFAYYIDHDGNNFGAVRHTFNISSFPGERLIESLEVFPIRYRHDHQQVLSNLKDQGRQFQKFLSDRHQAYNAWTLTRNPPFDTADAEDEILRDENGEDMRHPEFVESDVIVDMAEAYQKNPDWRPNFHRLTPNKSVRCDAGDDDMKIQHWLDASRQSLAYAQTEIVQVADGVEMRQRRENLVVDTFLKQRLKGTRRYETQPQALELRDDDLVLLPKRMFAYVLRERRFMPVNTNFLKPIRRQPGVFENLKILKDYKDIVRGLVASHFQRKALERRYVDMSTEGPSQDLIQNKGRGLVVLLHGVPGVGKTATAEAVAMEYKKPLFVITCGDLGLTPHEVESSLSNVFRLAHLWDCVLLLDEADVFLSQRSKLDMKRNALVSVFLRVLEYYNGLLFLTTNRVGTIDEAFKSRIHMSLYYPPLDKNQTRDIFRLNIAKLREIEAQRNEMTGEPTLVIKESQIIDFAGKHFEENARSTGCWNGRQIRNAFQIASSLAHHNYTIQTEAARELGQQPPAAPMLDRSLFEKVQMSTQSFDRHMMETKGFDADLPLRSTFYQEGRFE
ncbi:putative cell division cycle ATPase [Rosellinia necatrix]|uniref:Putative cell division cycle ATPase n=1 Tax=Rosellinia necatrix TaxID=77044 RepID=A0A1W2TUT5_ROSNE|nr:putative cell division cycle ATPase [Rosellinia necatrix]